MLHLKHFWQSNELRDILSQECVPELTEAVKQDISIVRIYNICECRVGGRKVARFYWIM